MKKIFFPGVLLALMFIFSCSKDEFTEEDAVKAQMDLISHQDSIQQVRDSLEKVGGILQFSVSVVPVDAGTGMLRNKSADAQEMLSGATVSVSQHGQLLTATTDESGIAAFTDLRVGELNVSVRAGGYTSTNFIAYVDLGEVDERFSGEYAYDGETFNVDYRGVQRHAAVMIPVFNLTEGTSNISGVVTYETDLTNEVPETAEGVNVTARIDVQNADFRDKYFNLSGCTTCEYAANITQVAYNELIASSVTDADGMYSIEIASAADGLPVAIEVDDVVADQDIILDKLYGVDVFGVQTVRTLFNDTIASVSTVTAGYKAYVEFSEPEGVADQQPLEEAEATAVIGESGIAAIIITDEGDGYTQPPLLRIDGDGVGAEAVAYIAEGKVTSVEITKAGKGYTEAEVVVLTHGTDYGVEADASPVVAYGITTIDLDESGDGYTSTPDVVITSSSGSGASAEAEMTGYVDEVVLENMGSGYVCPPIVLIERGEGTAATTNEPVMTDFNPIYGIELSSTFMNDPANWYEDVPSVEIVRTSKGSGATAVVQLGTTGTIDEIVLSNMGSGYSEAPSVIITGEGTGAVAWAAIDDATGEITSITVEEGGKGYKAATTTVQISNPPASGTAPVVDRVVVLKPIVGLTLTNPGSGYDIDYVALDDQDAVPNNDDDDYYTNEPAVEIDGVPVPDLEVVVRPDMSISEITMDEKGTGYNVATPPAVIITPKCGYGTGATASTTVLQKVAAINVTNSGSGYVNVADIEVVVVTPPEGCDEQALASVPGTGLGAGVLTDVTLDVEGTEYMAAPTVILYDGSDDVVAHLGATVADGSLTSVTFDALSDLDVSAYYIEITTYDDPAEFADEAYPQSGKLSFVQVDVAGAGYASAPLVKFHRTDDNGDIWEDGDGVFIPAQATVTIADGRVVAINLTNPGTGYYYPPVVEIYVPDGKKTAKGTVTVNTDGFVESILLTGGTNTGGEGYATPPTVTIRPSVAGMGSGAAATAVIEDGIVTKVVINDNGSGYLGKNTPSTQQIPEYKLGGSKFNVFAGKSYVRDIYLGTGVRNEDYDN